jgi:hypothetical protein
MTSKSERSNQLTPATDYDVKRMVFSDPQAGSVPNTPIVYKRIPISTLNKDGTTGDLILPTEDLFSFGVSENINPETKKVNGHVLPLCLWNKNAPTAAEKAWTDTFDHIVEHCKKHLIDNRDEIEQYDLSMNDLKKFNPLYWKREKGKIVEGTGPTLYAKLISSKKHNKILSMFFNPEGESIDPLALLGKYCYAKAAIKIESIFIGNKISLQVKLYEVEVRLMDGGMKPLMSRPKNSGRMLTGAPSGGDSRPSESKKNTSQDEENDDDDGAEKGGGSLHGSDGEEDDKPAKPAAKPVRKVIKKVVKK